MLLRLQPGKPFLVSEAATAGVTRGALRSLTQSGALRRLLPGVYVDAQAPDTQLLRASALALVLPSDAVACRGTAAWLLGVPVDRLRRAEDGAVPIEVCRDRSTTGVRRQGVRGFVAPLPPHDVLLVHGVPCTSPVRTALDLARWCDRWDGLAYLDAMVRFGLVSKSELEAAIPSLEGLPWCEQGRELLGYVDPGAGSAMESFMRLRYLDAGFPAVETQVPILDESGIALYFLDCGILKLRFGFEYDGEEFHGPEQATHDAIRRSWIVDRGWRLEVVRKHLLLARTPEFECIIGAALGMDPVILSYEERRRTRLHRKRLRTTAA
jgi:hypothetical protein